MGPTAESVAGDGVIQTYIFHDPPHEGLPHRVRATTTALVAEGGEVFIGVSVCSEAEQFVKQSGREKSWDKAHTKMMRWAKGKEAPTLIVPVPTNAEEWKHVNGVVQQECLHAQLEKFREILSDRHLIIESLLAENAYLAEELDRD